MLSLCEPLTATLLAAVMLRQLPTPTQLLGAALLVGAGIAVQIVAARPAPTAVAKTNLPGPFGSLIGRARTRPR